MDRKRKILGEAATDFGLASFEHRMCSWGQRHGVSNHKNNEATKSEIASSEKR